MPFIGYENNYSQIAFHINFSEQQYSSVVNNLYNNIPSEQKIKNIIMFYDIRKPFFQFFIEPALTIKTGGKHARLVLQGIKSFHFGTNNFNFLPTNLYLGIELDFEFDRLFDGLRNK